MYAEISVAASAIKSATELVALVIKQNKDAAIREKAIETQSFVLSLQEKTALARAEQEAARDERDQLKQELIKVKNWKAEARRYRLVEFGTNTFAYKLKEETPSRPHAEPMHHLCANCYQNMEKSILQREGYSVECNGYAHACARCKTVTYGP